jgi:hypothetical protein
MQLVVRMHKSSPWRALQGESRFWVVAQVARRLNLNQRSKQAALQRLRDLAITPAQTVQAILLELEEHLDGARQNRTKDTQVKVQGLLDEAQASKGYPLWEAAILHFKAKHLLASNDFDGAGRLFRMALESVLDRNYGLLRGEIAQDCLALAVANGKLVANNHEKYYREMLAGGIFSECRVPPPIEEAARLAYEYFWETLYKPYPGVQAEQPHTGEIASKMFRELLPLLISGETGELKQWIKTNHSLLKRSLPDVDGNSVLMSLTKLYIQFVERLPLMRLMDHPELHREIDRHETMMKHWRQFLGQLAKDSPKQLNMADIKGQTPLMLITQMGDVELLAIMLQAGADPDAQDRRGATALHSAAQLRWDGCVDVLLDHPCTLDKVKFDGHSPLHTATWAGHIHAVKRLSQLAPELAWLRDANGKTPLELAEFLVEHPDALEALAERLARDGKFCASKQELEAIAHILEQVPPVAEARLS